MVVHLSCVAQYEETSFHATDNDCVALKVWVAGPGSVESWRAAVRSQIKVANLCDAATFYPTDIQNS